MSDAGNWCLIESDPGKKQSKYQVHVIINTFSGVFTELIRDFGKSFTGY